MKDEADALDQPQARRFLLVFTVACVMVASALGSVNYGVDRYRVFHPPSGEFTEILEPNTRFLKAEFLSGNCSNFDAVIMGSSRDVGYLTSDVDRVFGVRSYNYGVAAGNLRGVLSRLEWLERQGCFPGRIFLPISIDRLRLPQRPDDLLRKEHPAIVGTAAYRREFVLSYIGADAFVSNFRKLIQQVRGDTEPRFRYRISTGDVFYLWNRTFEIDPCQSDSQPADDVVIEQYAEFLSAIKTLAGRNQGSITLFLNPQPLGAQLVHAADAQRLFDLIGEDFPEIYRLPVSDQRLRDSDNYHDRGHFHQELGAAVFSDPANRVTVSQLADELASAAKMCPAETVGVAP